MQGMCNKKILQTYLDILGGYMGKKRYTLENLSELKIEKEEITVEDSKTGKEKTIKTVSSAEVSTIVAYLLGVPDKVLEEYYSHHYGKILEKLRNNKEASIIRYLSKIRTELFKNFYNVDNEMVYNLSNLDRMSYFSQKEIEQLHKWGIQVIQTNYRAEKYIIHITRLIDKNIDECKKLFPESVKFEFIRTMFVVPKYEKKDILIEEYNKFKGKKKLYPFQMYMYWEPDDYGNILYSDSKLLNVLYEQNGETFNESYKYKDASDNVKENIYDFIRNSEKVIMAVDCENADPYKLYGVIKNLDEEELKKISRIELYDDYHTTIAWDYIEKLINIPVVHIEVERVTDRKSLVDMSMAVGVAEAFCIENIDSFILCSSDSDFWGLISSIPKANYLVFYENIKCGKRIKEALTQKDIFHCDMDDFYMENATELQKIVLKKTLESYLPSVVGESAWELTKKIYADAYIKTSEDEMRRFCDMYIKNICLKLDKDGKFRVIIVK